MVLAWVDATRADSPRQRPVLQQAFIHRTTKAFLRGIQKKGSLAVPLQMTQVSSVTMESRTLALRSSFGRTADCLSAAVGMSTRRSAEVRLVFWTKYITRTPDTSVVHHAVVQ
ncbi:hypothetical protein SCLCIDRAFT_1175800 [Scleroderma citrinum Foug A]|uniref:Uncharacterized protein n=1 Tax=Scleroderma citrinum Foug A TaxID=1036808 RepID=A0A0C3E3N1_9AGAM|nr:hypothetical protein SCLCIDRAFT_1175800 [Scleroderma citrinum Foug A]